MSAEQAVELSDHDSGRARLAPRQALEAEVFSTVSSSACYGLQGRFQAEPLRLHDLLLYALVEAELATRPVRAGNEAGFYDSLYRQILPFHDRAAYLTEARYEVVAAWLAGYARPYLRADEREAKALSDLLVSVVLADGWPDSGRARAESLSHSAYNRPDPSQAAFAVAGAANPGRDGVERVCQHVFSAVAQAEAEDDGQWREPLLGLARLLSSSPTASKKSS